MNGYVSVREIDPAWWDNHEITVSVLRVIGGPWAGRFALFNKTENPKYVR